MRQNIAVPRIAPTTHEGGAATNTSAFLQLRRSVLSCLLWEKTFYEDGQEIATRIRELCQQVSPEHVAALAVEARTKYHLRHVPLLLCRELARHPRRNAALVREALVGTLQRPDELGEFLAIYWEEKRQPLSHAVKSGLAKSLQHFSAYQLAKWRGESAKISLRDVLRLVHPKPTDDTQAQLWGQLQRETLTTPDTWEVALSRGDDKRNTWERLLTSQELGGLALLRNLRNMCKVGVPKEKIAHVLATHKFPRVLPFRFIAAAREVPELEPEIEAAFLRVLSTYGTLRGKTILLVDVSGSMDDPLSARSVVRRVDAACGIAMMLRELCATGQIFSFSNHVQEIPGRHGFALRDAIVASQAHSGTYLGQAVAALSRLPHDRFIVMTDEQSHDTFPTGTKGYCINVGCYRNGVSYRPGWIHIDGFSEAVVEYIRTAENDAIEQPAHRPQYANR